ncbi:MAG TPA: DUF4153 domain-containing protein [Longimicrobiales bacterium]|nr:DUF4153 domain-containing protein [Longimicrobiales bacterium]
MSTLARRARGYLADAARGFERAPLEVALALFVAVAFSVAIEIGGEAMPTFMETAVPALLALAVAWTGTLLHALGVWSWRTRWAVTIAGVMVVAGYAQFVIDFQRVAEGWRAAALVAAAVLWLFAVPAFGAGPDAVDRMRRIDGRILLRTIAVLLYAAALYAGLALALAAINNLFELNLEGEIYGHVFGWIFFVLVPWVVLGGLDDYVRPAAGAEAVASAVHRLTLYLVPPLLALYFLILYAYMVRIAITGEVPKNLVSPLVLAAGALTALALLLFDPEPDSTPFARALRLAPPLLLPLMPLGVWALMLRIDQYGWTENRALRLVLLAAFTALAAAATVQLWRRRPFALHVLPAALAVTGLLAVLGPWSVLPLARRSQQLRLQTALDSVARLPVDRAPGSPRLAGAGPAPGEAGDTPAGPVRTVPAALYDQVQADARYLHTHFGRDALPAELAPHATSGDRWRDYAAAIGLQRAAGPRGPDEHVSRRLPGDVPVPLQAGTLYRIEYAGNRARDPSAATLVTADSLRLVIRSAGGVLYADLAPLLAEQPGPAGARGELAGATSVIPVLDAEGAVRGELIVLDFTTGAPQGRRALQHVSGMLLLPDTVPRP